MIRTDLKKIRKELKQTQKEFASIFGVPQSFISQIENGIDPMPASWIPKLVEMLGISDLSEYQIAVSNKNQSDDILSRLRMFFEYTGLPQGRIAMQCGLTAKMLHNIMRGEGKMDLTVFLGLVNGFGQLNLNWLLTGQGEMIYKPQPVSSDIERIATLVDTIAALQKTIEEKDKTIATLSTQVENLKREIKK